MMEFVLAIFVGLFFGLYYVEKYACEGKIKVSYGWLAYSLRPILFCCALDCLVIFRKGSDLQSTFWKLIVGLSIILIGIVLSVRFLRKRKEIEDRFRAGKIKPGSVG